MENTDSSPQQLVSEMASQIPQNKANPSKFYSHFLCKAVSFTLVLVILPFFPSEAPKFINQTIFIRSWELIHLLFVGIAVSYGLFCRRNFETEKENQTKIDTTQTYMSRIFQISSVFDDEVENPSAYDVNKVQIWNSSYFQGESAVVVAQENCVLDEQRYSSSNFSNKPLFLPIRSLRSSISDSDSVESVKETNGSLGSLSRSSSGSRSGYSLSSDDSRNGEIGDLGPSDFEEKLKENVVVASPIPWKSRSGRMERRDAGVVNPPLYSLPASFDESEFDRLDSFHSPIQWSSQPNSTSPSSNMLSSSPSLSPEPRTDNVEEVEKKKKKKKSTYKSSHHRTPSLPPTNNNKSTSISPNSSRTIDGFSYVKSGFKDELKDLSRSRRDAGLDSLKSEAKSRTRTEGSLKGKSFRTIRASEPVEEAGKAWEADGVQMNEKTKNRFKEVEAVLMEKEARETGRLDSCESPLTTPKLTFSKSQNKEKKRIAEKVALEYEENSITGVDDIQGSSDMDEASTNNVSDAWFDPNEVDKKAAEFIAKFREQIRRQKVNSINGSSRQHDSTNSSR